MTLSRRWLLALATLGLLGGLLLLQHWRQRPVLRAQVEPLGLAVGEPLTYTDSTFAGNDHHWRWEFGQGSVSRNRTGTFRYDSAGTYQVRLMVDSELTRKFVVQVKSSRSRPDSTIRLLGPTAGYPLEQLMFQTTGAPAHTFTWQFGDGAPPSHGPVAFHAFAQEGTYTVRLTTDVARRTLTQKVTIERRFNSRDKITVTVVDSSADDIRWHLQHIANGEEVNQHYQYLLANYLHHQPDLPVAVKSLPTRDFYSYCMSLQFDSGWVIDSVVVDRAPTSKVIKLNVLQHKRSDE